MTVFVSDTMSDTNGTLLSAHTPDTGGTWVKRSGTGDFEIQSNQARITASDTFVYYTNAATPGNAEYDVTSDWVVASNESTTIGLLGRLIDSSNFYHVFYKDLTNTYTLRKKVSGSFTILDTLIESLSVATHAAKLEIRDASKKLYIDTIEKLTSADDVLTDAGNAGVHMQNLSGAVTSIEHDNFVADDVGEAESQNASMQPIHHWWPR